MQKKGVARDEMIRWHHWVSGHEFKQTPGVGDGQGACMLQSMESQRVGHDSVSEQQQEQPTYLLTLILSLTPCCSTFLEKQSIEKG